MRDSLSFHAQHSPMGAHSSFTVGMFGAAGGMALEKGEPAESGVFVGYRTASGVTHYLPFFKEIGSDAGRFGLDDGETDRHAVVFGEQDVDRDYRWASDCFRAPGVTFEVVTPFFPIPDPAVATEEEFRFASCPAVFLTLTITNNSPEDWEGFFALQNDAYWSPLNQAGTRGFTSRGRMGFMTRDEVEAFSDVGVAQALERRHSTLCFLLGPVAGVCFKVPPGGQRRVDLVLGFYITGQATFNHEASYWYTQYFRGLNEVLDYAAKHRLRYQTEAGARDRELADSGLSRDQQFILAHATRSYYGSTAWLTDGRPLWVVNEGEYLMINTLDLTVDMLFFELRFNPWTVRNVLEQFVERYAYRDEIFSPDAPERLLPGGISFAHDMGVAGHFSPQGSSSYECSGLDRECFSYMTCEQLTNWILCAGVYVARTNDREFLGQRKEILLECLESLLRRDHPDPEQRSGLMSFESSRTCGGGEITTYDSLDHSLGQARSNIYLAGKCWASYLALEYLFRQLGAEAQAEESRAAAVLCATALENAFDEELGIIPAVLEGDCTSAIIPAVEALVYPWEMGLKDAVSKNGPYGGYVRMLRRHLKHVLQPGICLYDDGGWKLSSSADNSWMSKICLNQYVARAILGMDYKDEGGADEAHARWETEGSKFHACSDQFASGKPIGSRYYPRIVTAILWLDEHEQPGHSPVGRADLSRMHAISSK